MSKDIQKVIENKEVGISKEWEDKLAAYAVEAKGFIDSVEEPGMKFFSTKGGNLKFNDEEVPHNTLLCVVLTHAFENTFYTGEFSAADKSPPPCFSLGTDGETLRPHENSVSPQNETCKGCPQVEWRSGKGRAKACSNKYRLALLPAGAYVPNENPELITSAKQYAKNKIGYLRIPPTSYINYSKYVTLLRSKRVPPFAVYTLIKVTPDDKTILQINFEALKFGNQIKPIQDVEILEALELRVKEAADEILTPYEKPENIEEVAEIKDKKPLKY